MQVFIRVYATIRHVNVHYIRSRCIRNTPQLALRLVLMKKRARERERGGGGGKEEESERGKRRDWGHIV
jgi:hypothetical protein